VAEALFYQENDSGFFILARGHITAAVSTELRELVLGRLTQAPAPPVLAVDLSRCDYMDSTFMGLLVGFHMKYKTLTGRPLTIRRPSPECVKLLSGLGILKLMTQDSTQEGPGDEAWLVVGSGRSPNTEVLLTAHRNLSELSPENEKKFSVLQSILEKELEKKDPS